VAGSLAAGAGLEAVELAIRTAVTRLGGGMLERLLAADSGYRAPGTDCGTGHQAEFVSYRDKTVGTVLGTVTVSRAWYHCGQCGHGLAPRDAELGTAGQTMSPGLRKMAARAAEAVPFARGAGLVADLAGITLTGKRLGRHAEADGRAAAAGQATRAADLLREHPAGVGCDPLAIRITARLQPSTGPGDDFEDLAGQLPAVTPPHGRVLHDALTRAARVVMTFKYGAAAHSARDYPLIYAGGRSGKVRVLRSGHGL